MTIDDTAAARPAEDRAARPKRGEVRVEARVYTPHRRHVLARTLDLDQANDPRFLVERTLAELARAIAYEWQGAAGAHREQVEHRRARRAAGKPVPGINPGEDEPQAGDPGRPDEKNASVSSVSSVVQQPGVVEAEPIAIVVPIDDDAQDDTDDGPERAPDLLDEIAGTAPVAGPRR